MKKTSVKKISAFLISCVMALSITACKQKPAETKTSKVPASQASENTTVTPNTSNQPKESATSTPKTSTSINKIEAGLGDLKLYYNSKWTYDAEKSQDATLAFTRGNTIIGVTCSQETTYQIPQDMMKRSLDAAKAQEKDIKIIKDMKEIKVNGDIWYECSYQTGSGDDTQYYIQRTYGKNYYAYSISYMGVGDDFEAFKSNALTILDSCILDVPDNKGEQEAKKELIGELDAGSKGYLELRKDGTYYWYSDSSKSMDNVHYGTYACDNKIKAMNIAEGKNGYYLALFPSKYFVNGEESDMAAYKIEFAFSKAASKGADYQAINLLNYSVYDFVRIK
ncbi:hypothetical protein [[Clostridium] polysaccharolyticum]|uniref:Uncharacterized protein n=1 Tax=[Clostridium] polysaccharolyticum TaxID=29364 RepID=A0A1H9YP98_9FIRM|nr:hypothetical protein [[Clostridium] polysaccharolyticum]SES70860.1 hypothetical protein SAMN04487772_102131 [[Clostridium] polysaccharolyticum]